MSRKDKYKELVGKKVQYGDRGKIGKVTEVVRDGEFYIAKIKWDNGHVTEEYADEIEAVNFVIL